MENNDYEIEIHLKDLRKKSKLSQEELAEKLGISRQSIIALEQGRFLPSLPLAVSMCRFFDSAFEDLFDFEMEIGEEMDRIFEDSVSIPKTEAAMPKIYIEERKDYIEVKAELSGMNEEEIDIDISDGILTITIPKK